MNRNEIGEVGRKPRSIRRNLCAAIAVATLVLSPLSALAEGATAGEKAKSAGIGVGSALVSLVYAPVKLVYAVGGLVVGGLAYAFSGGDSEVANVVLTPSLQGDYVISPKQLTGAEPFEFFGRDPGYRPRSTHVAEVPVPDDVAWEDDTW